MIHGPTPASGFVFEMRSSPTMDALAILSCHGDAIDFPADLVPDVCFSQLGRLIIYRRMIVMGWWTLEMHAFVVAVTGAGAISRWRGRRKKLSDSSVIKDLLSPFWLFSTMPALINATDINSVVWRMKCANNVILTKYDEIRQST